VLQDLVRQRAEEHNVGHETLLRLEGRKVERQERVLHVEFLYDLDGLEGSSPALDFVALESASARVRLLYFQFLRIHD